MIVRPHIVIAEDDEQARSLLMHVVQRCHPQSTITAVDNGLAAFDICTSQEIDLLITDNQMPGMLGIEVVQQLRSRHIDMPILLLSGDIRLLVGIILPPATCLITKPIDIPYLMQFLKQQFVMKCMCESAIVCEICDTSIG